MNISLILGHPQPGSFDHAIAETAPATLHAHGHAVHYHDLYAEGFDPILPYGEMLREAVLDPVVAQHCDEIANADGIIIVHPNWWGQPPAVLYLRSVRRDHLLSHDVWLCRDELAGGSPEPAG